MGSWGHNRVTKKRKRDHGAYKRSKRGRKGVILWKAGESVSLLDDIRVAETPGKRGGEFLYAQAIYAYFDEIEKLKAEGFTLATICKFLEKKEALPIGSNPYSFRRAFRREAARRKRIKPKEENIYDTEKKDVKDKKNDLKRETLSAKREPIKPIIPVKPKSSNTGTQINPDNTFKIAPIDPDDLPDVQ